MICTVLNENTSHNEELEAEHGLSLHIQADNFHCLFDFGQTERWLRNAQRLGIDASSLDFAVLSHGHYDHAGGLKAYLDTARQPRLFRAEKCWESKGSLRDGVYHDLGIPGRVELRQRLGHADDISASCSPFPGVHLLVPENPSFPDEGSDQHKFVIHTANGYESDEFLDELTLVIEEKNELVVFSACAHRGIFTVIDEVHEYFPRQRISALIGGFHLRDYSDAAIRTVARGLSISGIRQFYPCHCTGERAVAIMTELMPHRVSGCRTGTRISLS